MFSIPFTGLDRTRLRRWLALFFLALALPTGFLVYQAWSQLKWEAFHQHRVLAEELATRIDARLVELIDIEEARAFAEYAFLNVAGDPAANFLQRSPLSVYPHASGVPGLVGYFQVDTRGAFTTPLLPPAGTAASRYGISAAELKQRLDLQAQIGQILSRNQLVESRATRALGGSPAVSSARHASETRADEVAETSATMAAGVAESRPPQDLDDRAVAASKAVAPAAVEGQAAFDRLNQVASADKPEKKAQAAGKLGRVKDLKLDYRYQSESVDAEKRPSATAAPLAKQARKERAALPEAAADRDRATFENAHETEAPATQVLAREIRIRTFESEIDPFEFSRLDSGHLVLFRKVWRDGTRYIQGALIEQQPFVQGLIESRFLDTALSGRSELLVAWRGDVLAAYSGRATRDVAAGAEAQNATLLYQSRLSAPLGDMELIFSIQRLPAGPGARVVGWLAAILTLVLCGGFYLMYRLGAGQIDLTSQQQDFVSAVSHELKTPLTSIRMYGEMLREGWVSEEKKKTYYDFIFDESERLSRLITNVLQLARMTRNTLPVERKPLSVAVLTDGIRFRVATQAERAGFELNLDCAADAASEVIEVDEDGFIQIFINLVDNAIKFSAGAERKVIDIACRQLQDGSVQFSVRDYGPGIHADQMKKIFKLFYRTENELTRETVGTGIGLALVNQLARAMGARVDVVNREPGAEFRIQFVTGSARRAETDREG